ncbi:MAG: UPF0058 family protein [archaeon]|nr:UPF0058 family protein [archaeon]
MKKEELVHLHVLLAQLKRYCVENEADYFKNYDALGVTPFKVHRSKEDHKQAVFVLVAELNYSLPKAIEHYNEKRGDTASNSDIGEYLDI